MRISLTIWRQTGTHKINLSLNEDDGNSRFVIEEEQNGKVRRVLSKKQGEQLQELIDELSFPVMPQSTKHGGNTYMLQLDNGFNSATFNWCSEVPKGWEKINELTDFIIEIAH